MSADTRSIVEILEEARGCGFLGPQPVQRQLEHSRGFSEVILAELKRSRPARPVRLVDLGAGGGVPGLVLAVDDSLAGIVDEVLLLEGSTKRAEWLKTAVTALDAVLPLAVIESRAEIAGRSPAHRHQYSVVVARSFGKPAVVSECAAPLLRVGGFLVVSEPPSETADTTLEGHGSESFQRWPAEGVAELGMSFAGEFRAQGAGYVTLRQQSQVRERFPRRDGVPARKPLF